MNDFNDMGPGGPNDASARHAEISRLFQSIRQILDLMIQTMGAPDGHTPKAVIAKLNELQAAHLKVLAAEEAFHAQQGDIEDSAAIDFDAIRFEIGGQLDRLRQAIMADKLPFDADPCAACRAALSF